MRRVLLALVLAVCATPALAGGPSSDALARLGVPVAAAIRMSAPPAPVEERVLDIPWHHQAHALSCEAAALAMALSYFGVRRGELDLMALMGYDRRPARFDIHGRLLTWGDPNAAYVGNPDGNIDRFTGYGVYFAPVARAVRLSGVGVLAAGSGLYGGGVSPHALYAAVLAGHPAVVWISNLYRTARLSSYVAYDGSRVWYTLTEHAVTVIGVRPGAVLIDDPWFGRAWRTKSQFESAYATFRQMAVILG